MAGSKRKNQQLVVIVVLAAGLALISVGVFSISSKNNNAAFAIEGKNDVDMSIVSDRTSAAAPEMTWITTSRVEIEELSKQLESLQKSVSEREKMQAQELTSLQDQYDEMLIQQASKIAELEGLLAQPNASGLSGADPYAPDYSGTGTEFIQRRADGVEPRGALQNATRQNGKNGEASGSQGNLASRGFGKSFNLASLDDGANPSQKNTLKNYIPAGSYAPALVLSGADAATNVADRESPIPVLFRVTGPAVSAIKNGVAGKVDIEGCTVQGSAIGDLSSERVLVRLISMTCLQQGNEVIETAVSGYMVGAGKTGVRGHVVSREGGLVTSAAIAGALEGLSGAASGAAQATQSVGGITELATAAATATAVGGVQEAASTLSEYLVSRAEQYQPVVSMNGGSIVELVFMEGVSLK